MVASGSDGPDRANIAAAGGSVQVSGLGSQLQITGSEPSLDTLQVATLAAPTRSRWHRT